MSTTDLFEVGEEVATSDLAAISIPGATYYRWAGSGVLARTCRRGVYWATRALNERLLDVLVAPERVPDAAPERGAGPSSGRAPRSGTRGIRARSAS